MAKLEVYIVNIVSIACGEPIGARRQRANGTRHRADLRLLVIELKLGGHVRTNVNMLLHLVDGPTCWTKSRTAASILVR